MANTNARHQRCLAKETQNGAVYLEAVLRNVEWTTLLSCWNTSLTIGVFSYLQTSTQGQAWLATTAQAWPTVASEVAYWTSVGITTYETQWQNYKQLGVAETFAVQNAFGFTYPLTIKRTRGALTLGASATSFKMYWSFASDLWAVATNTTMLGGLHLIRESPQFAFTNFSLASALAQNATLPAPLGPGLNLVHDTIGPFGSIDAKRVACPDALRQVYRNLTEALVLLVNVN
ncbi:hypothetical protein As57867_007416, partial [Aphanomyces stellatus]